jgi:hypothetical protein
LLWVVGITNNENADPTTKKARNEQIQSTEKHPKPHKVDRMETSTRATKIMEQHDNRDERAQTTHQPTQNKLLQNNTRSDHEPWSQTRMPLLWSIILN